MIFPYQSKWVTHFKNPYHEFTISLKSLIFIDGFLINSENWNSNGILKILITETPFSNVKF